VLVNLSTKARLNPTLSQMDVVRIFTFYFVKHTLILSFILLVATKNSIFTIDLRLNILLRMFFMSATCPTHLISLVLVTVIMFG
jgi:hypothetical protein